MKVSDIQRYKEITKEATRGPWEHSVWYCLAGVNDGTHKGWNPLDIPWGKCLYCHTEGTLVKEFKQRKKTYHLHRIEGGVGEWHDIYNVDGVLIAGNYDYEDGGICSEEDSTFICMARTAVPQLCESYLELVQVLHDLDAMFKANNPELAHGLVQKALEIVT